MEKVLGVVLVIVIVYFFSQSVEYVSATECNGESLLVPKMPGEKMGLPIIPSFCTQNGTVEGLLNGLSFGSSPATIINTGNLGFQSLNHDNNATGSDFQHGTSGIRRKNSCRTFTNILVKQMIRAVKNPYNANARNIICLGIGPRECSPRAIWESYNSTSARNVSNCAEDINQLVLQYNAMLCDNYQGMVDIMHNPELYGFSNVKDSCCELGRYGGMAGCVSDGMVCRGLNA